MTRTYRQSGGLAVLVAVAAIGLAACTSSSDPQVASLGTTPASSGNGGSSTSSPSSSGSNGNPTQLLDEWATCMRSHGDPNQADPTIDVNKVIHVIIPSGAPKGSMNISVSAGCQQDLTAAQLALRGGKQPVRYSTATLDKYAECMRANGIPDFPDPSGEGFQLGGSPGGDMNPNNPTFQHASKVCGTQTGTTGLGAPQQGTILVQTAAMAGANG